MSNLLRPKQRGFHYTEGAFLLLIVVGDSACETSVFTSIPPGSSGGAFRLGGR